MKPPVTSVKNSGLNTVSNAKLCVRKKSQSQCLAATTKGKSPCSKVTKTSAKVFNEKVGLKQIKSGVKAMSLSATWNVDDYRNPRGDETYAVKNPQPGQKVTNVKTDDKPKHNTNSSQHYIQLLKNKDQEISSLRIKLESLSGKPKLETERIGMLEEKLRVQSIDVANLKEIQIKLKAELSCLKNEIAMKNSEVHILKSDNLRINAMSQFFPVSQKEIDKKVEALMVDKNKEIKLLVEENYQLKEDIKKLKDDLANQNVESSQVSEDEIDLEKEIANFLGRVSHKCKEKGMKIKALSKDKNVKINLKITVRKSKFDRRLSFSEAFESPGIFGATPFQTVSVKEDDDDCVFAEKDFKAVNMMGNAENLLCDDANLFPNPCEFLLRGGPVDIVLEPSNSPSECVAVDVNLNDNCRASLGTFDRAEDLDKKLQELWSRLSSQGDNLERLKSEKRRFTFSVDLLEEELTESRTQHKNLVEQVNVVKRLFS